MFNLLRSFLFAFICLTFLFGSDVKADGKKLYQANCSSCHKLDRKMIGPALAGIGDRHSEEWLLKFIRNSQEVIKSGDEYAVNLYNEYNQTVMPAMALNDDEILSILDYIETETAALEAAAAETGGGAGAGAAGGGGGGMSYETMVYIFAGLAVLLLFLLYVLVRVKNVMDRMVWEKENPDEEYPTSNFGKVTKATKIFFTEEFSPTIAVLTFVGLAVVVLAFDWYERGQDLGTQIGYAPEQPVKFSHALHAGQNQIDCQYCHTGVEKGKSAQIPSVNVCMNCHNYVQEGPQYGEEEIAKVVAAYENDEPIEWVRIHNLPDHVYFSHAQHVAAGNLECETCHGDVKEMEVLQQHSTLEMGWCIDCHRETGIDTDNEYYKATYDFAKDHSKVTVSEIGGLECAKCHY